MSPTIHDVARAANVSPSTVSRALAGSARVAPATRERIARIAADLGYEPNRAAQQLVTGRARSVGLVVPDLENPFYAAVAKGITRALRREHLTAVVTDTEEDADREAEVLAELASVVDRVVLASPRAEESRLREWAGRLDIVLINRRLPGLASVTADNSDGIAQALRHLRALGHRRIGYAGGPLTSWSDAARREALAEADGVSVVDLGHHRPGAAGGIAAADQALAEGVSAVLAFNDQLALGILGRLADRGVAVPAGMSVVGFDDVPVAALLAPPLTTVAVPAAQMGQIAVGLLMESEPGHSRARTVPVQLHVRRSSGPA